MTKVLGVNSLKVNKSTINSNSINKIKCVSFSSSFDKDSYNQCEFNYSRLSVLISQMVPMKKLTKLYNEMMDDSDESSSIYVKLMTLKTRVIGAVKRKISPEWAEQNIIDGCSQAIGMLIPEALKVPRRENLFDVPYEVNMSIINILNSVENYDEFYDAIEKYTRYMDKYGYTIDSKLPMVTEVKPRGTHVLLKFDKPLEKQEN